MSTKVEHDRELKRLEDQLSQLGFLLASNAKLKEQVELAAVRAEADRRALKHMQQLEADLAEERRYNERLGSWAEAALVEGRTAGARMQPPPTLASCHRVVGVGGRLPQRDGTTTSGGGSGGGGLGTDSGRPSTAPGSKGGAEVSARVPELIVRPNNSACRRRPPFRLFFKY